MENIYHCNCLPLKETVVSIISKLNDNVIMNVVLLSNR